MFDKPHSFGGSSLDRYVFEFDPDDEVGGGSESDAVASLFAGGAEAVADPAAAAEAGDEAADAAVLAPSGTEPAATAWAPDEDDFRTLQEQQTALVQYLAGQEAERAAAAQAETVAPEMPQMLDPDYEQKLAEYLDWRDEQRDRVWQERFDRVAPVVQAVQEREAEALRDALIDSLEVDGFEKENPEFREGAEHFAVGLIDQVKAELGLPLNQPSARAAQIALQRGAEKFTAFARTQREAGKAAYVAEIEALGGAPKDLGVTGGAREGVSDAENEEEAVRRLLARATS